MTDFNSENLALSYISRFEGRRFLFPIKAGAKFPPLIRDNLKAASNDPEQIKRWAAKWPGCNWGLSNDKSGTLVVDVDTKPGKVGQQTYDLLDVEFGFPKTETVETPSGGRHYYYEGEHVFALGVNGFGRDIDSPNYVLIAGCQFTDGTSYSEPVILPTVPTEQWFYDVLGRDKKVRVQNADEVVVDLDTPSNIAWAQDHLRNDAPPSIEGENGEQTTFKVAATLRDMGISETTAVELMDEIYNVPGSCEPMWELDDLIRKVANAYTYANLSKIGGRTAEADFADDDPADSISGIVPQNPNAEADRAKAAQRDEAKATGPDGTREKYWKRGEVVEEFIWCVGIERMIKINEPTVMWKKSAFDSKFAYLVDKKKKGSFADSLLATTKDTIRRFDEVAYLPGQPKFLGNGKQFNCYIPSKVVPAEGDVSWWDEHLEYLFPDESQRSLVLNWMAWLLQNLALKPKHALLVQGAQQGTGKSYLVEMLSAILDPANVASVSQNDLQGAFNGWALRSKLIWIEELRAVDRGEVKNKLHDIITQEKISINEKNIPQQNTRNCFGVFCMTNDDAAISLEQADRRYLVVRTDARPRPDSYYDALYARLNDPASVAAVAYALQSRDLQGYDARSRAPNTAAKQDMIDAGLSDLEQWMLDNQSQYPLNGRVVAVKDIVESLPKRLERSGRLSANIASILKKRLSGVLLGQTRLSDGVRVRLFAINGSAGILAQSSSEVIAAQYEASRAKAGKVAEDTEESDFGMDEA